MSAVPPGLVDVKIDAEDFNGESGMWYLGSHRLILSGLLRSLVCSLSSVTEQSSPIPRLRGCDPLENASSPNDSAVIVRLFPSIPVMMNDMRASR